MSQLQDTTDIGGTAFERIVFGVKPRRIRAPRRRNYSSLGMAMVAEYVPLPTDSKYAAAVVTKVSLRPGSYLDCLQVLGIVPSGVSA